MLVTAEEMLLPQLGVDGQRELVTEWPRSLRRSDSGLIRMTFQPLGSPEFPASASQPAGQSGYTGSPGYNQQAVQPLIAQARLELAGMDYRPNGVVSEAFSPGKAVRFSWSVRTFIAGKFPATLWLYLREGGTAGTQELRKVISAQVIEIQVQSFLGLSGNSARVIGSIGLILGVMILVDIFSLWAEWLLRSKSNSESPPN